MAHSTSWFGWVGLLLCGIIIRKDKVMRAKFPGVKRFTLEISPEVTELEYSTSMVATGLIDSLGDGGLEKLLEEIASKRLVSSLLNLVESSKKIGSPLSVLLSPDGTISIEGIESEAGVPDREDLDMELQMLETEDEEDD